MKKGLLIAALFVFGASAVFAQNSPAATEKTAKPTKAKKSKKSKAAASSTAVMYECPMKCEPATAKAGKCGKCGMDLKAKKA
jgi:tRNA/tmRNA/rRNA uracil-C5-methylase (TrmA/RlmC/RlmD family)